MISLKDYAKQNNITYEAVRAQVKRYYQELEDHIIRDGRTQYLDDVAVAFLDERRQKNPVVVYQQSKDEAIEALKNEVDRLLRKQEYLRDKLDELREYKELAEQEKRALEDAKTAQERRERELAEREANMAEEIKTVSQEASEAAKRAADEYWVLEVDKVKEEAQKAREDADYLHQQELAARDEKIRELESRNLWHYLTAPFRKKGKE